MFDGCYGFQRRNREEECRKLSLKQVIRNNVELRVLCTLTEICMSFGIYLAGFLVVVVGLVYGAYLAHVPNQWIVVMVLCLVGIGVLKAVSNTRQKDPN